MKLEIFEPDVLPDKRLSIVNKDLPKPPFRWIITGPSGSGKSNLIKNIVFNFYKKYFSEIYVFIMSKDDALEYERLTKSSRMKDKVSITTKIDFDDIQDLYEEIEDENAYKKKNKERVLMVFDDAVIDGISNNYKRNIIDRLFIAGRHANISTLISTQKYKMLNANMRMCNCNVLTVFNSNGKELQQIAEEHNNLLNSNEMFEMLKDHLKKKYSFLTIDYTKSEIGNRFRDNEFNSIV